MEIIEGVIKKAQKVVLYGPEGIGKSTLASRFPKPLYIDTEGSTSKLDVRRLPNPSTFTMLKQEIQYVIDNPTACKTLIIDTADWAEQLLIDEFCKERQIKGIEDVGYGKGYVYVAEEFGRMLNLCTEVIDKGINVVFTAHAQMRKFEQPDEMGAYDRWEMKLSKKAGPLLKEWADMILFCNFKTVVVNVDNQGSTKGKNKAQGSRRVMYTQHHACWDAKNRDGLKEELNMDYSEIAQCIPGSEIESLGDWTPQTEAPAPEQQPKEQPKEMSTPTPNKKDMAENEPTRSADVPKQPQASKKEPQGVPPKIADLIRGSGFDITEEDIMNVVAQRGYFPFGTRMKDCPEEFIDGWMVPYWDRVVDAIKQNRKQSGDFYPADNKDIMPFN